MAVTGRCSRVELQETSPINLRKLTIVFHNAGGGHRSAANALCEVVSSESRPWEMQMMNLQELLAKLETPIVIRPTRRMTQGELETYLDKAADILRGNADHSEFRGYVFQWNQ